MRRFLKDLLNVPNTMSLFRLVVAPLLAVIWLSFDWPVATLVLGTFVGLTDAIDGYVARKLDQVTELGALIDQLGDLVFESTCLVLAVLIGELWYGWLVLYLFREFTVTVVRSYVLAGGGRLPSTVLGKAKSSCIQWAFFFFFLGGILERPGTLPESWTMVGVTPGRMLLTVGATAILSGIACGLLSAAVYLRAFVRFYVERQDKAHRAEG